MTITHRQTVSEVFTAKTKNVKIDRSGLYSVQAFFVANGKGSGSVEGQTVDVPSKGDLFSITVDVDSGPVDVKSTGRVDVAAVRWSAVESRTDDRHAPTRWAVSYRETGRGLARVQGTEFRVLDGLPYREPVEGHEEDAHYRYVEIEPWRPSIADDDPVVSQSAWLAAWYEVVAP